MAGCLVGLMLAGAFIQQYFNYVGGRLYRQDSVRLKCFLHAVMALAMVSELLLALFGLSQGPRRPARSRLARRRAGGWHSRHPLLAHCR